MLSKFIFVLTILSNDGSLSMSAFDVPSCPDKQRFVQEMDTLKDKGEFISWQALCIERGAKTQEIKND